MFGETFCEKEDEIQVFFTPALFIHSQPKTRLCDLPQQQKKNIDFVISNQHLQSHGQLLLKAYCIGFPRSS